MDCWCCLWYFVLLFCLGLLGVIMFEFGWIGWRYWFVSLVVGCVVIGIVS